ncbi:uncharacterized protein LOC136082722 [Hydra vulgaris]|uniref:Uncharacterized protein LOC136082722 n=1 Tax=Hydra vulgaris TaxID=6087 RepID=A0ABM4C9B2_HYDVU
MTEEGCTPDASHKEQMSIILQSVTCTPGVGINISKNFFGYLTVNDTSRKGLFDAFLNQAKNWDLNNLDYRGQSYDDGANMKVKVKGVQARFLEMSPKAFYVPCTNYSLNFVIVDGALPSISAISFFGVHSRLEERVLEKRDKATATEVQLLTEYIRTWPLSIIIWYDVLFQINKSSELLQTSAISLDILASDLKATNVFLNECRKNGFSDARIKASEIAEVLGIEKTSIVTKLYDFLYQSESLIKACNESSLSVYCKSLQMKPNYIDSEDLEKELKRFVIIIKKEKNTLLKSEQDFLNYIYKEELQETYPNLVIALGIILTLPVTAASPELNFSKPTMVDECLSSSAMLSIENKFAYKLSYEGIIIKFVSNKTHRKPFFLMVCDVLVLSA